MSRRGRGELAYKQGLLDAELGQDVLEKVEVMKIGGFAAPSERNMPNE